MKITDETFFLECKMAARNGLKFLAKEIKNDGTFVYSRDVKNAKIRNDKYNMLRHCGCVWAMNLVNKSFDNRFDYEILKASNFIESNLIKISVDKNFCKDDESLLLKEVNPGKKNSLKLGGIALAILALNSSSEKFKDTKKARKMLNGLLSFIDSSGLIKFSIFNKKKMRPDNFYSEYYPGEAVLAMLNVSYDKISTIIGCIKICESLRYNRDKDKLIHDHWLLQALDLLYHSNFLTTKEKQFCYDYAYDISMEIMNNESEYIDKTCPIACRTEGLISFFNISKKQSVLKFIEKLLKIQMKNQVKKKGDLFGSFTYSGIERIDYTQHNISGFIRYCNLFSK